MLSPGFEEMERERTLLRRNLQLTGRILGTLELAT
jgi:hypothetical protein